MLILYFDVRKEVRLTNYRRYVTDSGKQRIKSTTMKAKHLRILTPRRPRINCGACDKLIICIYNYCKYTTCKKSWLFIFEQFVCALKKECYFSSFLLTCCNRVCCSSIFHRPCNTAPFFDFIAQLTKCMIWHTWLNKIVFTNKIK